MRITKRPLLDGYVCAYYDMSQAEPRSICYLSNDPNFISLYENGGEVYEELAIQQWLAQHNETDRNKVDLQWVKQQRAFFKKIILSGFYDKNIKALAAEAGIPYLKGKAIWDNFIGQMTNVAKFKEENLRYAKEYGFAKTILGEKIPIEKGKERTQSSNYVIQNFTGVILTLFFYNCLEKALAMGIDVSSKMLTHDANIIEFPIKYLLHMDLICRKYLKEACTKYFNVIFEYEWDLMFDLLHHNSYQYNIETETMTLCLWRENVDYFLDHFSTNYTFKILQKDKYITQDNDNPLAFFTDVQNKKHRIIESESITQKEQIKLVLKLDPIKDIDWWQNPLEETLVQHLNRIQILDDPKKKLIKNT